MSVSKSARSASRRRRVIAQRQLSAFSRARCATRRRSGSGSAARGSAATATGAAPRAAWTSAGVPDTRTGTAAPPRRRDTTCLGAAGGGAVTARSAAGGASFSVASTHSATLRNACRSAGSRSACCSSALTSAATACIGSDVCGSSMAALFNITRTHTIRRAYPRSDARSCGRPADPLPRKEPARYTPAGAPEVAGAVSGPAAGPGSGGRPSA